MDYEGDGDLDILSGSYTGEVYLFVRDDDGTFQQGVFLRNHDGEPLQTGTSVTPEAHDLDGDGDLDLLIGTRTSGVFWHPNLGTRTEPSYAAKGEFLVTAEGARIQGSNAHYADWDQDGVRDLVLGSEWGDVVWHRNLASDAEPSFAAAETLIDVRQYGFEKIPREVGPAHPGSRTKVHVTDWNGDGRVDLLVGDVRWLYYTLEPLTAEEEAEQARLQPIYDERMAAYREVVNERNGFVRAKRSIPAEVAQRMAEAEALLDEVRPRMSAFRRERSETHGYVWLYLRGAEAADAASTEPMRSDTAEGQSVSLRASARPGEEVDRLEVTLRLQIDAGWHTYAKGPPGGGYPVTTPSLKLPEGFEQVGDFVTEGKSMPATDGSGAVWFVDAVVFRATVRRPAGATGRVEASVSMMVCDDTLCLPPSELVVSLDL